MRWFGAWVLCLVAAVAPLSAANIRRVDFDGFDQVPLGPIREQLKLRPGLQYNADEAEEARRWLEGRGVFSKVELVATPQGQVVDLLIKVVEHPLVQRIVLEGNTQISSAALRPSLKTQAKRVFSTLAVALDANLIGKAYLDNGMRVIVAATFDPEPTDPHRPVTVTYTITELGVGTIHIEPLRYVRESALAPFLILEPGELVTEARLGEQRQKLASTGLFESVSPAEAGDAERPAAAPDTAPRGLLPLTFHVSELEYPLLTAATLPLVDLAALARTVRFNAVEVTINRPDFSPLWQPAAEQQAALAAAQAAAQGGDAEALYRVAVLTRELDGDYRAAARAARPALEQAAAGDAVARMHLAQVLWMLDEDAAAMAQASQCLNDPRTVWEAWALLLDGDVADLFQGRAANADVLARRVRDGLDALANADATPDLEGLIDAYRFYYTALTMATVRPDLKVNVALDSPASRALIDWVVDHDRQGVDDASARQLGRLLTIAGFAAYAIGGEAAPAVIWSHYQSLLKLAEETLLGRGLAQTGDPAAYFYLALCKLLRDDTASARAVALQGLAAQPDNERLVDVYLLACIQDGPSGHDAQRTIDILRAAIDDVQKKTATPTWGTWGGLMLLAKLQLALRDNLPDDDTVAREQCRTAAEAATQAAVGLAPDRPAGWWIRGMAQLKGAQPADALASYQKVAALAPGYREVAYALALSTLLSNQTDAGLAAMAKLAPQG